MPLQLHGEQSYLLNQFLQILIFHSQRLQGFFFILRFRVVSLTFLHLQNTLFDEVVEIICVFGLLADRSIVGAEILVLFKSLVFFLIGFFHMLFVSWCRLTKHRREKGLADTFIITIVQIFENEKCRDRHKDHSVTILYLFGERFVFF